MAFGTGLGLLFIEGQDKTIVWLGRVITESGVGLVALLQLSLCQLLLQAVEQM